MNSFYTREQLEKQIEELRNQRDKAYNNRVAQLKKYSAKNSKAPIVDSSLHNLEREIEALENKLERLF